MGSLYFRHSRVGGAMSLSRICYSTSRPADPRCVRAPHAMCVHCFCEPTCFWYSDEDYRYTVTNTAQQEGEVSRTPLERKLERLAVHAANTHTVKNTGRAGSKAQPTPRWGWKGRQKADMDVWELNDETFSWITSLFVLFCFNNSYFPGKTGKNET